MPGPRLTPGGRGIIVDPPDGKLPLQTWARAERESRKLPERGYDDPTAHCFVAGVPRSMYVPSPFHIVQTAGLRRVSLRTHGVADRARSTAAPICRTASGSGRAIRSADGKAIRSWSTRRNLNGKTWLNEVGEIVSHAERVVERFTPVDADTIAYEATVTDPIVYTRPWTIAFPMKRQDDELLEVACHEDDQDLPRLKAIRDAARAGKK